MKTLIKQNIYDHMLGLSKTQQRRKKMIQRPKQTDNLACLWGNNADRQYSDPVIYSRLHLLKEKEINF